MSLVAVRERNRRLGLYVRIGMGLLLSCAIAGVVLAQGLASSEEPGTPGRFADAERVALYLHNNPTAAVSLLEKYLTQPELDALERAMFPAPTDDEKRLVYVKVETSLRRLGLAPDDALLREISGRVATLPPVSVEGVAP